MILFLLATALVGLAAAGWTSLLRLPRATERMMAWFLLLVSQIVLMELLLGLAGWLTPAGLFLFAAGSALLAGLAVLAVSPVLAAPSGGGFWRGRKRGAVARADGAPAQMTAARAQSAPPLFASLLRAWPLLLPAVLAYSWVAYLGLQVPVFGWDSQAYHLPTAVWWLQAGRITLVPSPLIWANTYPQDMTLLFLWQMIWSRSDLTVNLSQLPFALLGAVAVYDLSRTLGARRSSALWGMALWLFTPLVLMHSMVAYVDLAVAGLFLAALAFAARFYIEARPAYALLAGAASGLVFGIKANGVLFVGATVAVLIAGLWHQHRSQRVPRWLISAAAFAAPLLLLGGYWYLRNLILYGNPIYPVGVTLLGHTLFPGASDIDKLINHIPENRWITFGRALFERARFYTYDNYHNGLGPQFPILALPAAAVTLLESIRRRQWLAPLLLLIGAGLILAQPVKFPRYLLYLSGLGGVAFAYTLDAVLLPRVRSLAIAAAVPVLALGLLGGLFIPDMLSEWDTYRSLTGPRPASAEFSLGRIYRAIEEVPGLRHPGNRLAYNGGYYVYELFGSGYENQVYHIPPTTEEAWLSELLARRTTFFFAGRPDLKEKAWIDAHPDLFLKVWADERSAIYLVKSGEPRNRELLRQFEGRAAQ